MLILMLMLMQAASGGGPIPCLPGPCPGAAATAGDPVPDIDYKRGQAVKPRHDTVKNAVGNVKAEASDPIPGVDTPSPGPHGGKARALPPCVATVTHPCPQFP